MQMIWSDLVGSQWNGTVWEDCKLERWNGSYRLEDEHRENKSNIWLCL